MTTLALLFSTTTLALSLPPGLLSALCYVESKHRVDAVHHDDGKGDSLGVCQIKLPTARLLGFRGTQADLMKPENNIHYAGKYLLKQLHRYQMDPRRAVSAYNAGTFHGKVDGSPRNAPYVKRVFAMWSEGR